MLIKSMSRKEPSFAQLVAYLDEGASDDRYRLTHNLYALERADMITELETNAQRLRPRKNGVVLYHEIVSIKRAKSLPVERQKEILHDIAQRYVELRAPECLAYGRLHEDAPHHLHYHLAISANPDGSKERHTLKKAEFRQLLIGLEAKVLLTYPELEQKVAIANNAVRAKTSTEGEVERRTKQPSDKARIAAALKGLFATVGTKQQLDAELAAAGFAFYLRGKTVGVLDRTTGRKHRLKTLGLDTEFQTMNVRLQVDQHMRRRQVQTAPAMAASGPQSVAAPPARPIEADTGLVLNDDVRRRVLEQRKAELFELRQQQAKRRDRDRQR